MYLHRDSEAHVARAAWEFPAVVISGPRRSGKTHLLRHLFPKARYWLLEDPDLVARVREDPSGWIQEAGRPAIVDEIQNAPELLAHIRARIDEDGGKRKGSWLITGSQDFSLMKGVSESMSGRAAILRLLPFSCRELGRIEILRGGFPEVALRPRADSRLWFSSYLQTYLERDVRQITEVRDLPTYRRFLSLLASRTGQLLNLTDIGAPLGLKAPTVSRWLGILATTGHVILAPPYFESFSKRLVKSPKLYWCDTGLLCHLLGIEEPRALERSPFLGPVLESWVAAEVVKRQISAGMRPEIYHFRDEQGLEVDFLVPGKNRSLELLEVKATRTPIPTLAGSLGKLRAAIEKRGGGYSRIDALLLHRGRTIAEAILPGVKARSLGNYFGLFPAAKQPLANPRGRAKEQGR